MIVKNEGTIIRETLENILAHVPLNYFVISDTGSDDNTVTVIKQFFAEKGIKGEIYHDKWVNFAHNRNLALQHAEGKTDYVLIFDADDRFRGEFILPERLDVDRYYLRMSNPTGTNIYSRVLMFRNDGSFYWRGVLHEFIEQRKKTITEQKIQGDYYVISGRFGARSNNPQKYLQDAQVLEKAFCSPEDEDLKNRYAFYTAQSYRDADMPEKAIEWYGIRAKLGGWVEEVYCSLLQIGLLKIEINAPLEDIQQALLAAYEYRPQRAESLYHLARHLRLNDKIKLAYIYASAAANTPLSKDILFVDYSVYEWKAKDELAVSAYWVENYQQCHDMCLELLANSSVPKNEKKRFQENLKFAQEKLGNKRNKKLVGISMVRNESDIIEAFVRHNLTLLDELYIVDHDSTDNTKEILNKLKEEGLPIYLSSYNDLEFVPVRILNNLMKDILGKDPDVDYIFPIDADEFIYCTSRKQLENFLELIPENRVGMYTWRGYLPTSTSYVSDFMNSFTEQREENILTPKVIIPRAVAEKNKLTIGSHFMENDEGEEVKSVVFRSAQHKHFYEWFKNKFDAEFIETEDLWLAHYPIRSVSQQTKKTLEKSILMAMKSSGADDVAWENQLKDLLDKNMTISLDKLRLIAYKYRSGDVMPPIQVAKKQALYKDKLTLRYLDLVEDSPLPTVARLILKLADKLRK